MTEGRTRSSGNELQLETLVTGTEFASRFGAALRMESLAIVAMSGRPSSVVEIGAALHVPIGVARVLVSDLAAAGYLTVSPPIPVDINGRPSREILERLPLVRMNAKDHRSSLDTMIAVVEHAIDVSTA